jgi:hypothetical protein
MSSIDWSQYEEVPKLSLAASQILVDMHLHLGQPQSPLTPSGQKLMNVIISVWEDLYPKEAKEWTEERSMYKKEELPANVQVRKHTGRSLASFPAPIYHMMKKLFPTFNFTERKNCMKLVKLFPMFQMTNKV